MRDFSPLFAVGIGLVVGGLNGLLAAGATLLVPAMVHLMHLDQRHAQATSLWVILPTSLVSLTVYLSGHSVNFDLGWKVAAGGFVGGYLGARLMSAIPGIWLKRMFAGFMLLAGVRMMFL